MISRMRIKTCLCILGLAFGFFRFNWLKFSGGNRVCAVFTRLFWCSRVGCAMIVFVP